MSLIKTEIEPILINKDFYAVKVSGNWRVIFRFEDGDVYDVDYLDYH